MDAQELFAPALDQQDPAASLCPDTQSSSRSQSISAPPSSISTARSKLSTADSHASGRGSHDSKPRLSKEQHETLERHYQCEPKPSTQTKKEFSTRLGVSVEKVNNWFQNRRAKTKHELKKQQESSLFNGGEPLNNTAEQYGHPLADNHFIDEVFYQTIGGAPDPQVPQFRRPDRTMHDAPAFRNFPTIPEEPAVIGEDPGFYNFFGLSDGDEQKVDLNSVEAIHKRFNPPSFENWDPSALLRSMQDAHHNASSAALSSLTDLSSPHPSHDFSAAGSLPGMFDSRRPSSSVVSMATAPTNSRHSSTSWVPQPEQFLPGPFSNSGPHASLSDAAGMPMPLHMLPDAMIYSSPDAPDAVAGSFQSNLAMPQPLLPSQTIAGYHPSSLPQQPQYFDANTQMTEPEQVPRIGSQVPSRCDSGTSMLADSVDQIELQASSCGPDDTRHPLSSSTLAARRQRRPAQLGQAALRSVSYHNGPSSANDSSFGLGSMSENQVRRIKSSTVLSGRIQKPASASSQRSPFSMSFSDATPRSPASFAPLDSAAMNNWQQAPTPAHAHMAHPMVHQPPLAMPMAHDVQYQQMMVKTEPSPSPSFVFPQQMGFVAPVYPPTPHESLASSTPPQKPTPELQIQTYQPREPVDPASLPPKAMTTSPRGTYQFQNFNQANFTTPRSNSLKRSTTPTQT